MSLSCLLIFSVMNPILIDSNKHEWKPIPCVCFADTGFATKIQDPFLWHSSYVQRGFPIVILKHRALILIQRPFSFSCLVGMAFLIAGIMYLQNAVGLE